MFHANKLRGKIAESGINISELSKLIGIDKSTFYRKMDDAEGSFTVKEVYCIADVLELSAEDVHNIFFS